MSRLLGVSLATIKRLTAAGELPYVQVSSRRPRYRAEDVQRFIDERCAVPGPRASTDQGDLERRSSTGRSSFASSGEMGGGDDPG